MLNFLKNRKDLFRVILLAISIMIVLWLLIAVIFIDNRWWWLLIGLFALVIADLILYKEILNDNQKITCIINQSIRYFSFFLLVFIIICSIFISALWLLGILLIIGLIVAKQIFLVSNNQREISRKVKKSILIVNSTIFGLLLILFCIPSFIANIHKNPRTSFSSSYVAVSSYSIYGEGTRDTEHIFAKSWYSVDEHYANDYVNIIVSNKKANNSRGSLKFGKVRKTSDNEIYDGTTLVGYRNNEYFMPTDEFKGDVARIILYMYVTYKDDNIPLQKVNVNLMKTWSKQDPVDQRERDRNNSIFEKYGYKNKFVTTPWLVGFIV